MRGQVLPQINDLRIGYSGLYNGVHEMRKKVENIPDKEIISIFAESKGALQNGEGV